MEILAVIPARGGSKSVPRKNIRPVAGKPLIAYTIETALNVKDMFHRIIVSTDDAEIADTAKKYGAEVPFVRPDHLSNDKAPTMPALQHAVDFIENQDGVRIDWVLLLQPTTPLRNTEDILNAIKLAKIGGCDSVISVVEVSAGHPIQMKRIENGCLLPYCIEEKEGTRRQDCQPPAYLRNGAIYLTRRDVLMKENSIWGKTIRPYVMPEDRSINIDSELDLKLADLVIREQQAAAEG